MLTRSDDLPDMTQEQLEAAKGTPDVVADPIEALAKLSPLEYDKVREATAKELGARVGTLDKEVAKARGEFSENNDDGVVEEINPWSEPVNGNDLLNELAATIDKYVVLPTGAGTVLPVWALGSYCMDAWSIWPKLLITSPEKRCGKTILLEVVEGIVYRALLASNISPSAIFRCIQEWSPSLLLDEADTFAKDNDELNGIINSGHRRRTATIVRSEKDGDGFKPKKFSTWCPQAIAGIGGQRDTLHDRSIHIEMRRKLPGETVQKVASDYYEQHKELRQQCLRWAEDNIGLLKYRDVKVPLCGNDRAVDNWNPIFIIADVAGGEWPERVLSAYLLMTEDSDDGDDTIGPTLLHDIKGIFDERGVDRIWSEDLVDALIALEEAPWCELKHGKPITKNTLATKLKPFKVKSANVRFGPKVMKGYTRKKFEDAWKRYLPPPAPPISNATTLQPSQGAGSSPKSKRYTDDDVAFQKTLKASQGKGCSVVAVESGVLEEEGVKGHPPELLDAAVTACSGLKLTAGAFISQLEPGDFQEIIDDPAVAKVTARSMNAKK